MRKPLTDEQKRTRWPWNLSGDELRAIKLNVAPLRELPLPQWQTDSEREQSDRRLAGDNIHSDNAK